MLVNETAQRSPAEAFFQDKQANYEVNSNRSGLLRAKVSQVSGEDHFCGWMPGGSGWPILKRCRNLTMTSAVLSASSSCTACPACTGGTTLSDSAVVQHALAAPAELKLGLREGISMMQKATLIAKHRLEVTCAGSRRKKQKNAHTTEQPASLNGA